MFMVYELMSKKDQRNQNVELMLFRSQVKIHMVFISFLLLLLFFAMASTCIKVLDSNIYVYILFLFVFVFVFFNLIRPIIPVYM